LDSRLRVSPGKHWVRVTSWGLPLCAAVPVWCEPEVPLELSLKVHLAGFALGMVLFLAAAAVVAPFAAALGQHAPGYEPLVVLAPGAAMIALCLLVFYALLPAFSVYTFRLVETGGRWLR